MAGVPVVGNIATGAIVGLTSEGAELCDRMLGSDVAKQDIPASCGPLISYLDSAGFINKGAQEHSAYTSAYLHVTNRCNLACTGCYSANAARNVASDPTLKDLFYALDTLAQLGVNRLVISGGEPFARDDLADVLSAAREAGFSRITVITNGVLCTPERVGSLSGLADLIAVSFDGASAQARAWLRGSQLFDVLAEAVRTCKDASIPVQVLWEQPWDSVCCPATPMYWASLCRASMTCGISPRSWRLPFGKAPVSRDTILQAHPLSSRRAYRAEPLAAAAALPLTVRCIHAICS